MTINPIFTRELVAAARRGRMLRDRAIVAAFFLGLIVATFGAWYFAEGQFVSRRMMSGVAWQSFLWIVAFHLGLVPYRPAAHAIAEEKDRRTLDFLLATPLSNAEIVLAKLAACLVQFGMYAATGLPVMLLLHVLGGVDIRIIGLVYVALACFAFLLTTFSIWISVIARDARLALGRTMTWLIVWLALPFLFPVTIARFAWVPQFVKDANAWVLASSPLGLLVKFIGGVPSRTGLLYAGTRMCGLQLAAGVVFLVLSIVRLRSAYQANTGGERKGFFHRLNQPGWRFRPRPPVSDDAILWRETTTARAAC